VVLGANWVFWRHNQEVAAGGPAATFTVVALLGMAGAALPASVIPQQVVLLRYIALLIAFLATAANLVLYIRSLREEGTLRLRINPAAARGIVVVGLAAAFLSIYMGVIKENAKLPCGIDPTTGQTSCLLSLHQSTQNFDAPPGVLP
ncbi:MAG: hypothetical protein M1582_02875, partial [Actinobacteria bacterium]|nr:hypothetical protein [Actinomycetota bacterium]